MTCNGSRYLARARTGGTATVDRTARLVQPPIGNLRHLRNRWPTKSTSPSSGVQALKWDGDVRQYVEQKISTALHVLRCACHIDADVTLGDIFRAVEQDPELVRFLQEWSWCNIDAFHSEARKPGVKATDLTCIEIAKYFEWDEREAQETIDVSGIGEPDEHGMTHYGIDFTPVNELVDLPVRLRPQMEIRKDHKKLGEAPCTFSLLEVLGEI